MERKIVNIRYKCCGLNFDAAIDCAYVLHDYDNDERKQVPIELYCFDHPDWDIYVMFQSGQRDNFHATIDLDFIKKETRKWIRRMNNKD